MAANKLRSSCDSCTNSKLKCSKEKPACARCTRQSRICVYSTSKRFGRARRATRASDEQGRRSPSPTLSETRSTGAPSAMAPSTVAMADESSNSLSKDAMGGEGFADVNASTLPFGDQDWTNTFAAHSPSGTFNMAVSAQLPMDFVEDWTQSLISPNLDDGQVFGSPITRGTLLDTELLPSENAPSHQVQGIFDVASKGKRPGDPLAAGNGSYQDRAFSPPSFAGGSNRSIPSSLSVPSLSTGSTRNAEATSGLDGFLFSPPSRKPRPRNRCEEIMLEQIKQLEAEQPNARSNSQCSGDTSAFPLGSDPLERINIILKEMLQCSCRNNYDVLALLSLALFKVISSYAAAVKDIIDGPTSTAPSEGPVVNGAPHFHGITSSSSTLYADASAEEDDGRILAQQILSRLTDIHPLIGHLSQLLQKEEDSSLRRKQCQPSGSISCFRAQPPEEKECDTLFSVSILLPLVDVLRGRLRRLSRDITEKLW